MNRGLDPYHLGHQAPTPRVSPGHKHIAPHATPRPTPVLGAVDCYLQASVLAQRECRASLVWVSGLCRHIRKQGYGAHKVDSLHPREYIHLGLVAVAFRVGIDSNMATTQHPVLISRTVFTRSFCDSQFTNTFVKLFFILVIMI